MRSSGSPPTRPTTTSWNTALWIVVAVLLALGVGSRLVPLLGDELRLLRQYPTEDGYLMLTIARNLALGEGLSTAAGTIPTNGTQPLMSFLYAAGFALVDGDRVAGVRFALWLQLAFALAGAGLLLVLGRRLFAGHPHGARIAWLATALWFAAGLGVKHGMNCLETGGFVASILLFVYAFLAPADPLAPWSVRRSLGLGALLGLVLWMRIDAVFLVLATCLARLLFAPGLRLAPSAASLRSAVLTGATASLILSPWLIHNHLRFGSVMPVSGRAEAAFGSFASNLAHLPVPLAEYALVLLPIPARFESHPLVIAASLLVLAAWIWLAARIVRAGDARRRTLGLLVGLYALGLVTYYGFFFGVPFFLSRYFFPLAAFGALLLAGLIDGAVDRERTRVFAWPIAAGVLALTLGAHLQIHRQGRQHDHFQVVEWIERNVPPDAWVGAIQTGTIGFFHDRAINLDGKVNPAAHEAVRADRIPEYVVASPIQYLADWVGLAAWRERPLIERHFELLVEERDTNLAVFRRRPGL